MSDALIIEGLLSAFSNLVHAYEEAKRINVQMEAIKADYRVKTRALEIKQEALEMQHKENMERIKNERDNWLQSFDLVRIRLASSIDAQKKLVQQTQEFLNCALDSQTPKEVREIAAALYKDAWGKIMGAGDNAHKLLMHMKPDKSLTSSSDKLIDMEEE